MSVPAAYIGVILIWSTTPLAIHWSSDGVGFLFGVTGRMVLGAAVSLMLMGLFSIPLPWHGRARKTYLAAGLGIFCAMYLVYWASQYVPSGWIALMFGMTPIMTGLMATVWLSERLPLTRIVGMVLAVSGLGLIFSGGHTLGPDAVYGVAAMLLAVAAHAASAVTVKRIGAPLSPMAVTTGGLLVAALLFVLAFAMSGNPIPETVPQRTAWAIGYLGLFGSSLGLTLYYYVLRHVEATRVALVTLITPVNALVLGSLLNDEIIPPEILGGGAVILGGLLIYQYGERLKVWVRGMAPYRSLVRGRASGEEALGATDEIPSENRCC